MFVGTPEPQFVENPENRCPVILLLDTSGSMSGAPITELTQGVKIFQASVEEDIIAALRVEVAVITFDTNVQVIQDFITVDKFKPPQLTASGGTNMGQALEIALDLLEEQKKKYKENEIQYYRPWIFLITDGAPTDTWQEAAKRLEVAEANGKVIFFAVGIEGADMKTLSEIAPTKCPPKKMRGLNFQSLFEWLSVSVRQVSSGKIGSENSALPVNGWKEISF